MSHIRAYGILEGIAARGELDFTIVKDINIVFS
jgi:hypothetical protein